MALAWSDLGTAIALVLVLEGVMPFLAPDRLRQTLAQMAEFDDRALRTIGGISMSIGVIVLYFVR